VSLAEQDRAIARMLVDTGFAGVIDRRVKGWRVETYLGPLPSAPPEQVEAHWKALARLSGRGHDANVVALQLAAEGFGCERLRAVLRDLYGAGHTTREMLDAVPGAEGDEPAERLADGIDTQIDRRTDPLAAILRHVRGQTRGRSDGFEDERGEYAWLTFAVVLAEMLAGEKPDDEPGLFDVAFDGHGAPAQALFAQGAALHADALRIIETTPLHLLAASIQATLPLARLVLAHIDIPHPSDRAVITLAAAATPFLLAAMLHGLINPLTRAVGVEPQVLAKSLGLHGPAALDVPREEKNKEQ